MNRICKNVSLIAFVALLTAGRAFTQTPTDEATPEAKAAARVAYVYVQTNDGVNVYDAASDGKLTVVKGSPFPTNGYMQGINGKYLISVGFDGNTLYSYEIEPDGGVGHAVSVVNTQDYGGSECGFFYPALQQAVLDHTGKYFYLGISGPAEPMCSAWQSYRIESNGELKFLDMFVTPLESVVSTISSNDDFAYGSGGAANGITDIGGYIKTATGALMPNSSFTETDPVPDPNGTWQYYLADGPKADPTGHLAAVVYEATAPSGGSYGPWQMASYTIDKTTGGIVSTNTWKDMPVAQESSFAGIEMSPSGKILTVYGDGLELFHFDGAAPIKPFKYMLPAVFFQQAGWDNDNHLYALTSGGDGYDGGIYAYTATPTSIKEVSGSPYKVADLNGWDRMIVVPKL